MVVAILGVLSSIVITFSNQSTTNSKSAKSLTNLRALHRGVTIWAADNGGNYPISFDWNYPLREYWFNAMAQVLYPEVIEKAGTTDGWVWSSRPGYEGTVLRSPNAEPDPDIMISSYGYNANFTGNSRRNLPVCYQSSKTVMFGDSSGKSHAISPSISDETKLNPRNGASAPYAANGKALVIYLDGHTESLDAERCSFLNSSPTDPFWGTAQ